MVKMFQQKFGTDVILIFGDYSRSNMKYQVSVRGNSLHNLFETLGGYQCFLIDEFRTSSFCNDCNAKVEPFLKRSSPRPWHRHLPARKITGLLRCTNLSCRNKHQYRIWNRDTLAVCNFRRILNAWRDHKKRPDILARKMEEDKDQESNITQHASSMRSARVDAP